MTDLSKIGSFVPPNWLVHASITIPTVVDAVAFHFFSRNRSSRQVSTAFLSSSFVGLGSLIIFNIFTRRISLFLESTGIFIGYKIAHFFYAGREFERRQLNERLGQAIDQFLKPFTLYKLDLTTREDVQANWDTYAEKASGILQTFFSVTDNLWVDLERSCKKDPKKMAEALMNSSRYARMKTVLGYDEPLSLPRVYRFIRGLSFILETDNPDSSSFGTTSRCQYHTLTPGTDFEKNRYLKSAKRTYNGILETWKPVIQELAKIDSKMAAYLVPDEQPFPGDVVVSDNPFKLHIPSMDLLPAPSSSY